MMRSSGSRAKVHVRSVAAAALVIVIAAPMPAGARDVVNKLDRGETERISVSSSGAQGDGDSGGGCGTSYSASDNGRYIAFDSQAGNLHRNDVNGSAMTDVFVFDRKKHELELVSVLPTGISAQPPANQVKAPACNLGTIGAFDPRISGDGRYVAFTSNLPLTDDEVAESTEGTPFLGVFVRDLKKKKTELASRTWNGEPALGPSDEVSISDDGRWVAFSSAAPNMTEDACSSSSASPLPDLGTPDLICRHVYARDRVLDKTIWVSDLPANMISRYTPHSPSISGAGSHVAFAIQSVADVVLPVGIGLPPITCPPVAESGVCDVLVKDLRNGKIELASVSRDGGPATGSSGFSGEQGQLSDNGRFVAFWSAATDLVPATPPHVYGDCVRGAYVRDLKTGRTERVSVTNTGARLLRGGGGHPEMSDDGRYVIFRGVTFHDICATSNASDATNAYMGDFIQDRQTGQADWVTCPGNDRTPGADTTNYGCPKIGDEFSDPSIGGNARFIVGTHYDNGVVRDDTNDAYDVFVRDLGPYPLGTGSLGRPPSKQPEEPGGEGEICIAPNVCIPPQGAVVRRDPGASDGGIGAPGAELYGASLAYRPELGDLLATIELEHLGPALAIGPAGVVTGGLSSIVYGLRFEVGPKSYEVRATSFLGGTFGLFDCSGTGPSCTQVTSLKGGYGTTGERVVVSLPLKEIGLERGGRLKNVAAWSGLGSHLTGATKILDRVAVR